MDSKRLRELAGWYKKRQEHEADNAKAFAEAAENMPSGRPTYQLLSQSCKARAEYHKDTVQALTEYAEIKDALDGLTAEDVVAMRGREQKATKGSWFCNMLDFSLVPYDAPDTEKNVLARFKTPDDLIFTCMAKSDIPRLLTVVEKLMGVAK